MDFNRTGIEFRTDDVRHIVSITLRCLTKSCSVKKVNINNKPTSRYPEDHEARVRHGETRMKH